jgi:membrane associated rhomboid family serine protease
MAPRLNIPPITRIALIVLIFQSTLNAGIRYRQRSFHTEVVVPYLALVPQMSLIFPWTFLATTFVENNLFILAVSVLTLFYGGRYLERAWTSGEFARFLLIVTLIPNLLSFATLVALFAVSGDMGWT